MNKRNLSAFLAAASVLVLGTGYASAQGTTPGSPPGPGSNTPAVTPADRPTLPGPSPELSRETVTVEPAVVETAANENTLMQWLPWILAAVAILAVLAFLMMRRKGGQVIAAGGNVAPPQSPHIKSK